MQERFAGEILNVASDAAEARCVRLANLAKPSTTVSLVVLDFLTDFVTLIVADLARLPNSTAKLTKNIVIISSPLRIALGNG